MFDAVLFDLDGTLIDTAPEIGEALNLCLQELELPCADAGQVRSWIGHGTLNLITEALAHHQGAHGPIKAESVLPLFRRNYRQVTGRLSRVFPGVIETLAALHARRVPMAVVSNKESEFGRQLLSAHRLEAYFDVMVFGDTLAARKPSPLPLQHCMQLLRTTPPRTLLIGDSEIDVETARNAEVPVWAVSYGYRHKPTARELGADRVIDSFVDVLPYLKSRQPIWADRAHAGAE
ncbi:phosphoglycolate phosphatase [Panacagrimonas sp.]|uniref:phosphoglycolate phosphatase n=1 Tax=Panacagrimonas sp. TaxID=2480088 RepID=UPI003B5162E0